MFNLDIPIATQFDGSVTVPVTYCRWDDQPISIATSEGERRSKWASMIRKIYTFLSLVDDWDGMGAKAPARPIVFSAIELACDLAAVESYPAPTRVAATPAGTVALEWQQPAVYTEAEIVAPYQSEWMQVKDGEPPAHWNHDGMLNRGVFPGGSLQSTAMPSIRPEETPLATNSSILKVAYWVNPVNRAS